MSFDICCKSFLFCTRVSFQFFSTVKLHIDNLIEIARNCINPMQILYNPIQTICTHMQILCKPIQSYANISLLEFNRTLMSAMMSKGQSFRAISIPTYMFTKCSYMFTKSVP